MTTATVDLYPTADADASSILALQTTDTNAKVVQRLVSTNEERKNIVKIKSPLVIGF